MSWKCPGHLGAMLAWPGTGTCGHARPYWSQGPSRAQSHHPSRRRPASRGAALGPWARPVPGGLSAVGKHRRATPGATGHLLSQTDWGAVSRREAKPGPGVWGQGRGQPRDAGRGPGTGRAASPSQSHTGYHPPAARAAHGRAAGPCARAGKRQRAARRAGSRAGRAIGRARAAPTAAPAAAPPPPSSLRPAHCRGAGPLRASQWRAARRALPCAHGPMRGEREGANQMAGASLP